MRIHRISFSGELAYEIYAKPREAVRVWQALINAGEPLGIQPYGLEALDLLRIEKGFPTGNELDGRTTLNMLNMVGMAKDQKDYIGRTLRQREAFVAPTVPSLVGLESVVPDQPLRGGGQLVRDLSPGRCTISSAMSPQQAIPPPTGAIWALGSCAAAWRSGRAKRFMWLIPYAARILRCGW